MGVSGKVENHTIDKRPITYILLIYKLATKQLEIKNQSKRAQTTRNLEKLYKNEKNSQKYVQKGYMTPHT